MSSHLAHYLLFLPFFFFFLTYYHCIPFLMSFTSTIHYVVLLISNKNLPLKKNSIPCMHHAGGIPFTNVGPL